MSLPSKLKDRIVATGQLLT